MSIVLFAWSNDMSVYGVYVVVARINNHGLYGVYTNEGFFNSSRPQDRALTAPADLLRCSRDLASRPAMGVHGAEYGG